MINQRVLSDEELRGGTGEALARAAWAVQRDDGALEAYDLQGPSRQYVDSWIRWYANERNAGRPPDLSRLRADQAVAEPGFGMVPSIGPVRQPEPAEGGPTVSRPPTEEPIVPRPSTSYAETGTDQATGGQPSADAYQQHLLTRDEYDPEVQSWTDDERMRWYQTGERPARLQAPPPSDVVNPTPPSGGTSPIEPPMPGRGGGEPPMHVLEPNPPQNPEPPVHVIDINLDSYSPLDDLARMGPDTDRDTEPDADTDDVSQLPDEERRRRRPQGG